MHSVLDAHAIIPCEGRVAIGETGGSGTVIPIGLAQCIGCGCLSLDRCKLPNPADLVL